MNITVITKVRCGLRYYETLH